VQRRAGDFGRTVDGRPANVQSNNCGCPSDVRVKGRELSAFRPDGRLTTDIALRGGNYVA